jgi:hydroxyacyl-ACP dehydratase HTD2-like protein with hotdog domain
MDTIKTFLLQNQYEFQRVEYLEGLMITHQYIHRVWASEELRFEPQNPLRIGQSIQQTTVASNIELKEISRGESVFVTEHRKIFNEQGLSITSYRTLAYLSKPVSVSPPRPNPLPPVAGITQNNLTPLNDFSTTQTRVYSNFCSTV